ncbi:MAG: translation elongation factor Ts [Planctomycetota bacterium]|jgi:elongation factor Ts
MSQITAAAVKALRDRTGLPMMDCKRALQEADGDEEAAVRWLKERGQKVQQKQSGRATSTGRIAVFTDLEKGVGAMIELRCETAPVANNEEFVQLANDLVTQLATGPGAATPEQLLGQPSPSQAGKTLQEQYDELYNRIREAFQLKQIIRVDGPCGGYCHHDGSTGVLLLVEGGDADLAKDVCMHVAAIRPSAVGRDDLDASLVEQERQVQVERARQEGKPEKIIEKMIEGRMRSFYAEHCLLEQPFVKGESDKETVGKVAEAAGMKIVRFVHWQLGKE